MSIIPKPSDAVKTFTASTAPAAPIPEITPQTT
jgi:hypothetical protein